MPFDCQNTFAFLYAEVVKGNENKYFKKKGVAKCLRCQISTSFDEVADEKISDKISEDSKTIFLTTFFNNILTSQNVTVVNYFVIKLQNTVVNYFIELITQNLMIFLQHLI